MKRIIIYSLLLTTGILAMTACSEDFLSPKPKSFYAPENVYTDPAGFDALLVTMRKNLVWQYCDDRNPMTFQNTAGEHMAPSYNQDWNAISSPSQGRYSNMVDDMYEFIRDANTVISRIDGIEWEDQNRKNRILAEAYWHRAYWYYRLVHQHGDVPFVGKEVEGARVDFNTHSRWAILDKIQSDMEFAVQHLPMSAIPGAVTQGAGNHLLAKIALANTDFQTAISAATDVINGPYALMTQRFGSVDAGKATDSYYENQGNVIWDLHRSANKNISANTETILAIVDRYEVPEDAKCDDGRGTMRDYHPTWWATWMGKDSQGNRGTIDSGVQYDTLGRGNPNVYTSDWYSYRVWEQGGFTWQDTPDLRRAAVNWFDRDELFYNNPASVDYGEPFDPQNMDRPGQYWATIYPVPYHKTYVPDHPNQPLYARGANGDWYVFRLAETYLVRAEAYFWNNQPQLAADDIDVVRNRSQAPTTVTAGEVTIDYIMDERTRELAVEEPRQNELNRVSYIMAALGMGGYSLDTIHDNNYWYDRVSTLNDYYFRPMDPPMPRGIEPYHFLWPIDDNIISENTLGRINQVPGYPGSENNQPPLQTIGDE